MPVYSREDDARLIKCLRAYRLSLADYLILDELYSCCHMRLPLLRTRAVRSITAALSKEGVTATISGRIKILVERGYVQKFTAKRQAAVRELLAAGAVNPLAGFPRPGDMDLTLVGASVMNFLLAEVFGEAVDQQSGVYLAAEATGSGARTFIFGNLRDECESYCERDPDVESLGPTTSCGPWCARWWTVFPRGFRRRVKRKKPTARSVGSKGHP
jgi:hypothetical protein